MAETMEKPSLDHSGFRTPEEPPVYDETEPQSKRDRPTMEYGELSAEENEKMLELDRQFAHPQFVEIEVPGAEGEKMNIEYVVLDVRSDEEKAKAAENNEHTVVHIPGFGSSYRSPDAFTKLLALREKKRVIVMSQPSTGKSDPAPKGWMKFRRDQRSFAPFAESLSRAVDAIRDLEEKSGNQITTSELSVSSSSMGSILAAEMAKAHPEQVKDLVLLHPGGVNEENILRLASRYLPETLGSKLAVSLRKPLSEKDMRELEIAYRLMAGRTDNNAIVGKTLQKRFDEAGGEGAFSLQDATRQETDMYKAVTSNIVKDSGANTARGNYREGARLLLWEALTIAKGGMLETLKDVKANTYVVFGSEDKLFPREQMPRVQKALKGNENVRTEILPNTHDEIYQRPRSYTARIGTFLDDMRKKERSGR